MGTAVLSLSILGGVSTGTTAAVGTPNPPVTVVASGLNNPRSLAWGPDGKIYVSEAGVGGDACAPLPPGPEPQGVACFGTTGSVSRISDHTVTRVVTGLASLALPHGDGVEGPHGLSITRGRFYLVLGSATQLVPDALPPVLRRTLVEQLGHLLDVTPGQKIRTIADPGTSDYAWSSLHQSLVRPGQFPQSNPYALLAEPARSFVVNSASNTLDEVRLNGDVVVLAFVPNPPASSSVPTCVARGPDGALYIGELTGFGNPAGAASVYRFTPAGGLSLWKTGFSAITGCGFGSDGSFYATEFDLTGFPPSGSNLAAGAVVRIAPDGTRTLIGLGKLFFPNGFLAGPAGEIYVTNWSVQPGSGPPGAPTGEVVRIG